MQRSVPSLTTLLSTQYKNTLPPTPTEQPIHHILTPRVIPVRALPPAPTVSRVRIVSNLFATSQLWVSRGAGRFPCSPPPRTRPFPCSTYRRDSSPERSTSKARVSRKESGRSTERDATDVEPSKGSKPVEFQISDVLRTVSYQVTQTQRRLSLIFGARFRRVSVVSDKRDPEPMIIKSNGERQSTAMRRKCECTGLMVSIEFGPSPLLGRLYRRTSGSAGPLSARPPRGDPPVPSRSSVRNSILVKRMVQSRLGRQNRYLFIS